MKDRVVIGMVGAGRACELHAFGYHRSNIPVRLKTVMARRKVQLDAALEKYGFEQATTKSTSSISARRPMSIRKKSCRPWTREST